MKTFKLSLQALCLALLLGAAMSCDNEPEPFLSVEAGQELQFGFDEKAEKAIVIKSNVPWTISTPGDCDWVVLNAAKGEKNGSVKVTVAENVELKGRNATLTVSASKSEIKPIEIKVSQAECPLTPLGVDRSIIEFDSSGAGSETMKVTYRLAWKITVPEDAAAWLTLSATEGEGDTELTATAKENSLSEMRKATLVVAPADGTDGAVEVTVIQDGAQYFNVLTAIPDMKFRIHCMTYDTDNNGILSEAEAAAVKQMNVADMGIASLEGIKYFTGLTSLSCITNELAELDLSDNTNLVKLDCRNNKLTMLKISGCVNLEELGAGANLIENIDLSSNVKLKFLSLEMNSLAGLNIEKNTALTELALMDCNLKKLDVSHNKELVRILCDENQLAELDITNLTKLKSLYCTGSSLTNLNLSNNTDLRVLSVGRNNLAAIDTSKNPLLTDLWVSRNPLTALNLSNNSLITSFQCIDTKLTTLDISPCAGMVQALCYNNEELTEIDISTCKTNFQSFACHNSPKLATIWVWAGFTGPDAGWMWSYPNGVEFKTK